MKTHQSLFSFVFLVLTFQLNAQELIRINKGCHFDGDDANLNVYVYPPSQEAQIIVQRITATIGLESNFIIKSANVANALAANENGKRYILYNTTFLENFKRDARTRWAAYCVLAHEIGHHLNNHNFGETINQRRKEMELSADLFAGHILQKMGATLDEAQAGINSFSLPNETITHPPKTARLEAVANGWKQAKEGMTIKLEEVDKEKLAKEWFDKGYNIYSRATDSTKILYFTKAIEFKPDYFEAYFWRGSILWSKGDYKAAIFDFDQVIRLDQNPNSGFNFKARAYLRRGDAKVQLQMWKEALADFDQACELDPKNVETFLDRGRFKVRQKDFTGAIMDFDKAIQLRPNWYHLFDQRGDAKTVLGKYEEAFKDYDMAILLCSKDTSETYTLTNLLTKYGDLKLQLGKHEEAINGYDRAILTCPKKTPYFHKLLSLLLKCGDLKLQLSRYKEAIANYDQAIEFQINPAPVRGSGLFELKGKAYANKGRAVIKMGDQSRFGEALDLINKAELTYSEYLYDAKDLKKIALKALSK